MFTAVKEVPAHDAVRLELTSVVAARIPRRLASQLMKVISTSLPIKHLQHLKRIRKCEDKLKLEIILCDVAVSDLSDSSETLDTLVQQHDLAPFTVEVPKHAPQTRDQLEEWNKVWPTSWKVPEGGPINEVLVSDEDAQWWVSLMTKAMGHISASCRNYSIIADPVSRKIIGESPGAAHAHPLKHPVMLAIEAAAANEQANWLKQGEAFMHMGRNQDIPQTGGTEYNLSSKISQPESMLQAGKSIEHAPDSHEDAQYMVAMRLNGKNCSQMEVLQPLGERSVEMATAYTRREEGGESQSLVTSSAIESGNHTQAEGSAASSTAQVLVDPASCKPHSIESTCRASSQAALDATRLEELQPTNTSCSTHGMLEPGEHCSKRIKVSNSSEPDVQQVAVQDPRTRQYLCTGFDCIMVQEPCSMCAMALVHSRVQRVVYCKPDRQYGVLGSTMRLHGLKSINHHYRVFVMDAVGGQQDTAQLS